MDGSVVTLLLVTASETRKDSVANMNFILLVLMVSVSNSEYP